MFVKKGKSPKGGSSSVVASATNAIGGYAPAPINIRNELPFQRHFAYTLHNALIARIGKNVEKPLPKIRGSGKDAGPIQSLAQLKPWHSYWVSREYAESRGARLQAGEAEAGKVVLPLPEVYVENQEMMEENVQAREFYNCGSFMEADLPKLKRQEGHGPRCGITGTFFRREELVDNMMFASKHFNWNDPFWFRPGHPGLADGGSLSLSKDAEPLGFSLTAQILLLEKDIKIADLPYQKYLSPEFCADMKGRKGGAGKSGINAFTGTKAVNPWILKNATNGWVTLDQLQPFLPGAFKEGSDGKASPLAEYAKMGKIVEVEHWEMYHSSALSQPSKLAYDKAAANQLDERRSDSAKGKGGGKSSSSSSKKGLKGKGLFFK